MIYAIKRGGTLLKSVKPTGKVTTKIMDEELLTMNFSLDHYFNFKVGDSVVAFNNIFGLQELPSVQKVSTNLFNYTLKFTGYKYELGKIQLMFPDGKNNLTLGDFSVNGNAQTIIELIVENANRISNGWTVGVVDVTDVRNFTFTAHNLLAALAILAEEYESEFWVDANQSINFQKRNIPVGFSIAYQQNLGLHGITRSTVDSTKIITRLYAFGAEKNLSNGYRNGSSRLKLPANYLEHNTATYGIIEHTEIFEDIYPHRVGVVTHVDAGNPLKFRDTSIDFNLGGTLPNSPFISQISPERLKVSLKDIKLAESFDINASPVQIYTTNKNNTPVSVLIGGVAAKVTFNSGQLAGYTFDIAAGGWNLSTKEITLIRNTDEKALELPNDLLRPAVGDKYVITDIIMPDSYVMEAENRLIAKAGEFLQKNSRPQLQYNVVVDHVFMRRNNFHFTIGNTVDMTDPDFGLNAAMRITAITQDLQNVFDVQFELSEKETVSRMLREAIAAIKKNVKEYRDKRKNLDNQRDNLIKYDGTIKKFDRIGDLELIPANDTLLNQFGSVKTQTAELEVLKIPLDAPIRTIDAPKITKWDIGEAQFRLDMTANPLQVYLNRINGE